MYVDTWKGAIAIMFNRAKLKTPIGILTAEAGDAFDGCPAILIFMKKPSGQDLLLAEIRYSKDNAIEMGDFNGTFAPDFVKIYEVHDDF